MTSLSAALEARDKATKGPWTYRAKDDCSGDYCVINAEGNAFAQTYNAPYLGEPDAYFHLGDKTEEVKMLAAAPDALDWIAKALPILKRVENRMLATDPETWLDYEMQLATLTALIAQAEGTAKEGEK